MNPGCVMLSPYDPVDSSELCNGFSGIMSTRFNNGEHKNDRSTCYSEVVIAVTRNGVIIRRRATRFVCGTIGGLSLDSNTESTIRLENTNMHH